MKKLNLALQGGGAHGAFTWGVLERLLEEPDLRFDAISGTSAGAMNAVMLVSGYLDNGAEGAKERLNQFWNGVALTNPLDSSMGFWGKSLIDESYSNTSQFVAGLSRWFSPYDLGLGHINPLRELVEDLVDFEQISQSREFKLFVAATAVRTGSLRVFDSANLTSDALLASACLPTLHKGVEIDGELYWDGGWSGNPVVFPLVEAAASNDILLVLLQSLDHSKQPRRAGDIAKRSVELGFTASFMREMESIVRLKERLDTRWLIRDPVDRKYKQALFHLLEEGEYMESLGRHSKLNIRRSFLETLKNRGRERAEAWLLEHKPSLGRQSSVSLRDYFGGG